MIFVIVVVDVMYVMDRWTWPPSCHGSLTGQEIREFRVSETTYFAVEQPSINLRASIGQPVKQLIKIYKNMQIVSQFCDGA